MHREPRVHVLLSALDDGGGYRYHGIAMRAQPLCDEPDVAALAAACARRVGLAPARNNGVDAGGALAAARAWSIGADLIVYRDGADSCGWHADDTQGETLVLAVVVESRALRRVRFRPSRQWHARAPPPPPGAPGGTRALEDGDEELELWIAEGDAYSMDGAVQHGYEHCVPKAPALGDAGRRMVIIFRAGDIAAVPVDTGDALVDDTAPAALDTAAPSPSSPHARLLAPPPRRAGPTFGHCGARELRLYSREALVATHAHASGQRGVAGDAARGAEAVVVSRQASTLREADGLTWLRYTSTYRQGAGALWMSLHSSLPVRVFRSSSGKTRFAPPPPELTVGASPTKAASLAAAYRYDGLYLVMRMWQPDGTADTSEPPHGSREPGGAPACTFELVRCDGAPNELSNDAFASAIVGSAPEGGSALPPRLPEAAPLEALDVVLPVRSPEPVSRERRHEHAVRFARVSAPARVALARLLKSTPCSSQISWPASSPAPRPTVPIPVLPPFAPPYPMMPSLVAPPVPPASLALSPTALPPAVSLPPATIRLLHELVAKNST